MVLDANSTNLTPVCILCTDVDMLCLFIPFDFVSLGIFQPVAWRDVAGVYPTIIDPLIYNDTVKCHKCS